jgi:hypothetical protein
MPILKNIEYLRFLKKLGHTIIIHTDRGMKEKNGNINSLSKDIYKITLSKETQGNVKWYVSGEIRDAQTKKGISSDIEILDALFKWCLPAEIPL